MNQSDMCKKLGFFRKILVKLGLDDSRHKVVWEYKKEYIKQWKAEELYGFEGCVFYPAVVKLVVRRKICKYCGEVFSDWEIVNYDCIDSLSMPSDDWDILDAKDEFILNRWYREVSE